MTEEKPKKRPRRLVQSNRRLPWIELNAKREPWFLTCSRCGTFQTFPTGQNNKQFFLQCRKFLARHKACPESKQEA